MQQPGSAYLGERLLEPQTGGSSYRVTLMSCWQLHLSHEREKLLGAGALADPTLPLALSAGVGPRSPSEDGSKVSS